MAKKSEVEAFLKDFKTKMSIFQVLFLDERGKNSQAILDLDITPNKRKEILHDLKVVDYSEGPIEETMTGMKPMWVFWEVS